MMIPFSPPDVGEREALAVAEVIRSGWITTGPKTKELEKKFASYIGTQKCVCLNSQTACAEMVLRMLGVGEGDEVIVPAYTYTASASVVCHVGAKLVLVDSQKSSLEMDYDAMERAITERTKVIIPVDVGGVPCDYDRVYEAVKRKQSLFTPNGELQRKFGRIVVLSDSAHSIGARRGDLNAGSLADFSAFSLHAVKNLTTAEGGVLTWRENPALDNDEIYKNIQLLSLHGQSKDALSKVQLGAWEYDIVGPWYKCNMTDISAAIGLVQLERYPDMLARRRAIIERYDEAFRPLGVETRDHYTDRYVSSGHLYTTRIPGITESMRNEIIVKMAERGVACNVHYKPLPMFTAYKALGFDIKDYPNAYELFANEVSLPLYTKLTDEQVDYIIKNYVEVVGEYLK